MNESDRRRPVVQAGAWPSAKPGLRGPRALLLSLLILVPATLIAGCVAEPSTELHLRRGDILEAELVLAGPDGLALPRSADAGSPAELCGAAILDRPSAGCPPARATYAMATQAPASAPDQAAPVHPLPERVVEALTGLTEGQTLVERNLVAFGERDPGLVDDHPRQTRLTRFVDGPSAYGRTWNGTRLDNGTFRIDPADDADGALLEVSRWCNERFCLFESRLVGTHGPHLLVEHQAREGQQVHVSELDTWLTVTQANASAFTVDGNDPRAGEPYDLYVHVLDARGPPQGTRRAPSFTLTTVNGSQVSLEDLLGRPVVLEFFATWCPSCIKNTEHLNRLEARFGDRIHILSIDVDPWEKAPAIRSFIQQNDVSWPVAVDEQGRVSQAYHVGSLSTEVLVSPDGAIVHVETGVADHDRVAGILADLLEAQTAAPSSEGPGSSGGRSA